MCRPLWLINMKTKYYILTLILLFNLKVKSAEIPDRFDLTIKEYYGCITSVRTYINFHFENNIFTITRASDDSRFQFEKFSANEFKSFFLKLQRFNPSQLDSFYICEEMSTASGFGSLEIITDKTVQLVKYTTQPCDGTNFENLRDWLSSVSLGITKKMTFKNLMESRFYEVDYIGVRPVLRTIEDNLKLLSIDDFIFTINSTQIPSLKKTLINSLQHFQDEKVLDLLGPQLINNLDYLEDDDVDWWTTENSIMLKTIISQKNSEKKREYLIAFLESKNKKVRFNSAIALANDKDATGIDIIFESINDCLLSSNYCIKWDEFSSLTNLSKSIVLPKLISNYKAVGIRNEELQLSYPWILKGYIASIINCLENNEYLSPEDLRLICLDMNLNKGIKKVEKKLKNTK